MMVGVYSMSKEKERWHHSSHVRKQNYAFVLCYVYLRIVLLDESTLLFGVCRELLYFMPKTFNGGLSKFDHLNANRDGIMNGTTEPHWPAVQYGRHFPPLSAIFRHFRRLLILYCHQSQSHGQLYSMNSRFPLAAFLLSCPLQSLSCRNSARRRSYHFSHNEKQPQPHTRPPEKIPSHK